MKAISVLILSVFAFGAAYAASDTYIISQRASLTIMPVYQRWSMKAGTAFSEASVALSVYYPLARDFSVSVRGAQSNTGGDVTKISSLTDTQFSLQYHVESADLLLSCGVNFPSGKKELTPDEFTTSVLLSNEIFNLQVPSYGQGLNVNPGFTWALPINDDLVIGFGATYQYKGKFKPLEGLGDYDPGDEILIVGGLDVRLSEVAVVSGDVIFTTYGKDKLGGGDVFAAGSKWVANAQFRQYFNQNELWLLARYRTRGKNEVAVAGSLVPEANKVSPNQFELLGHYRVRFNERFSAAFLAEGRFYETTSAPVSGITLFGMGIAPEILLSPTVSIPARIKFQFGSLKDGDTLSGFEVGIGIGVTF
jgi:hypothetical protein